MSSLPESSLIQAIDDGLAVFGQYVSDRRRQIGLTRSAFVRALDGGTEPALADVEEGRTRIPSCRLRAWASALRVEVRDLALYSCFHYEPPVYRMLFGAAPPPLPAALPFGDALVAGPSFREAHCATL